MSYNPPINDLNFVLQELVDLSSLASLPGYQDVSQELTSTVLDEAGKLASELLAPLNRQGDLQASRLEAGKVLTPKGWKQAYQTFTEAGWNSLAFNPEHGGQGLPWTLATAVSEMWNSSNMAFALCPMLTQGAIHALELHGSEHQQKTYLPNMIHGRWTGTMNLTEPQAGSDLSAVRSKAVPKDDHYLISGQKIFITYGDHDLSENIIHTVLARTPDAPEGVKGISLFLVPKFLINADGSLGERNDVQCVSLEHKLGIHASPTCALSFGEQGGAVGYLIGEENRGLEYMFSMMNLARHSVGIEGLGLSERAYQHALAYAKDRIQGRALGKKNSERVAIFEHADIRRMLLSMKVQAEAMRALALVSASAFDKALKHPDADERAQHQALLELLIPVVKAWSTEQGQEVTSLGIQIHGGMGYIEETGAAQYFRDARITTIYEGTTGIQAADLMGRKILRDQGKSLAALLQQMRAQEKLLNNSDNDELKNLAASYKQGVDSLEQASQWLLQHAQQDINLCMAVAVDTLQLIGWVSGAWLMVRCALVSQAHLAAGSGNQSKDFYLAKIASTVFYVHYLLPRSQTHLHIITHAAHSVLNYPENSY